MEYVTTTQATELLGIRLRTVQLHCQALDFVKTGGHYLLTAVQVEQVQHYMAEHPRGRRKNKKSA